MAFGLIIIGDEILSGRRADKHFSKVVELLKARGLSLAWAEVIGDDRARITATLKRTFASDDIVFVVAVFALFRAPNTVVFVLVVFVHFVFVVFVVCHVCVPPGTIDFRGFGA